MVGRRAFGRHTSHFADQATKLGRLHELSVAGSGGCRNAFIDQRSTEVVGARQQGNLRKLGTFFYPGDLQVRNPIVEHESRYRIHLYDFGSAGSRAKSRNAFTVEHGSFFVDETQRHEFGDSAGSFLDVAQDIEMNRFVTRRFNMAIHNSRGCRDAYLMGGLDQVNPLRGADSAGRNLVPYLVHENLCRSPRETSHARLLEGR